jgi:hypothetical protein
MMRRSQLTDEQKVKILREATGPPLFRPGGRPPCAAWEAFLLVAEEIAGHRTFQTRSEAATYSRLNAFFVGDARSRE